MPVLFVIAMLCFLFHYVADRLMITYWLDFPPVYDDELNFLFLHILKYTPVVFLPSALSILLWFKIVKNRKVDISLDIEVN